MEKELKIKIEHQLKSINDFGKAAEKLRDLHDEFHDYPLPKERPATMKGYMAEPSPPLMGDLLAAALHNVESARLIFEDLESRWEEPK